MLAFRLIARLDIKGEHLIKTIRLEGVKRLGDPREYARRYDAQGIDEILYVDAVASLYGRNNLSDLLRRTADGCFVPLTAAGGIRSVSDVQLLLREGADKVAVNTAAIKRPKLITEIAEGFGSQCVSLQLDYKSGEAYCDGGREATGRDALEWEEEAVSLGAGEIIATSIDREGTGTGCDVEFLKRLSDLVPIPVVAAGGVGRVSHILEAYKVGVSGVAMARMLHYFNSDLREIREWLSKRDVEVR